MTGTRAEAPEASTPAPPPPARWSLVLRPLGYLFVGLVWTGIWLVALLLLVGSVPYLAFVDSEALVAGVGERLSNPLEALGVVVIVLPVLALAIGSGGWYVLTASWPLAVLSFVYAGRALDRRYRGEKLSFTTRGARGSTFGPPTTTSVALSLQPVRSTAFTDRVMRFYAAGWSVDGRTVVAMLPAGLAWPCAIAALAPDVPDPVRAVSAVAVVVLLLASLVLGVRAFRRRLADPSAPDHDRPLTDLSAAERRDRLARVREQRRARLSRGDPSGT
ncbi:hypothetical protein ACQP60_00065 [Isoptericola variabilis]|uniref:hypothetical protein n=1 Tax=Isoptericola variabilis TaxID=139208 RepID=UPI003D1BBA24